MSNDKQLKYDCYTFNLDMFVSICDMNISYKMTRKYKFIIDFLAEDTYLIY